MHMIHIIKIFFHFLMYYMFKWFGKQAGFDDILIDFWCSFFSECEPSEVESSRNFLQKHTKDNFFDSL